VVAELKIRAKVMDGIGNVPVIKFSHDAGHDLFT
jgi:hypothetical protein